ncbi:carboxypeptidase-like regulatory domain-containing protein [Psychroserpens sp. XS_ASV72]|uniref:carboxypeptidase-like regulatory domain-containing protein n=1 Tax=Psychroserpens sp. XS_ASV72 TaxID=3241293 RepID=UPI003516EB3F
MKFYVFVILACLTLMTCSKDDSSDDSQKLTITGKFLAPNSNDPISGAHVRAYANGEIKSQTTTNPKGEFALPINQGDYNLVINKGKFKVEQNINVDRSVDLDSLVFNTLPNIAVVTGYYDNIESVLYSIGLFDPVSGEPLFDIIEGNQGVSRNSIQHNKHRHHGSLERNTNSNPLLLPNVSYNFGDLMDDPELMATYDIVFLNCGVSDVLESDSGVLENYVSNGGILYATDWASGYLDAITNSGANYITPYVPEKSGTSTSTVATILSEDLDEWLLQNFNISIDETVLIDDFLYSWQVIDSYDPNTAVAWLNGPVTYRDGSNIEISENKDLAFTFLHGDGAVLYSSFHTENNSVEEVTDVERVMQYLVFEMSDIE